MSELSINSRFLETTRGQVISLLRRGDMTVDELANALGLTENAIRNHLSALERDGLIRSNGVRRVPGAGKPAVVYEVLAEATTLLSRAYPPVLRTLLDVLGKHLSVEQIDAVLRDVGHSLASSLGGQAHGNADNRIRAAASRLNALGGDTSVLQSTSEDERIIQGSGCPLAAAVAQRPEVCAAVETLVQEISGLRTRSHCAHGPKPSCRFAVSVRD